jgi:hypothetical protein
MVFRGGIRMRRITVLCLAFFLVIFSGSVFADSDNFLENLEGKLQTENAYYHKNTVTFEDTISFQGEVTKVIKQDDPNTDANEQELEKHQANLMIGLAKYKEIRGNLFTFDKKELYFYDVDKEEFLTSQNVIQNKQADDFFQEHMKSTGTEKSTFTEVLIALLMLILIFIPWLIALIQGKRMPEYTISRY